MTNAFSVLRRLFNKNNTGLDEQPPIDHAQINSNSIMAAENNGNQSLYSSVGWETSTGKRRDHNQDALMAHTTNLVSNNLYQSIGVYAVADGMGGHKNGDLASKTAIQTVYVEFVKNNLDWISDEINTSDIEDILRSCTLSAHNNIREKVPEGGTTLTIAVIIQGLVVIAHIGDSRAYFVGDNRSVKLLTRDHSYVSRMQELGKLTDEQAAAHPQKNVLYRALGQTEYSEPDLYSFSMPDSSSLLLCSDGLWDSVSEKQISSIITESPSPQIACKKLVEAANNAGGPDNISAIVVRFPERTI